MKSNIIIILAAFGFIALSSCGNQAATETELTPVVSVKTTAVKNGYIESSLVLNGKTTYLRKNTIVSPISGYVGKMNIRFGDKVKKDDILFEIQTRESKALEDSGTLEANSGIIKVAASSDGIVDELTISGTGFFIAEGGTLCTISEYRDLMVLVNVPYEYNSVVKPGTVCKITLTDNTEFNGTVYRIMPTMNESSQTQNVYIKPSTDRELPENLNLRVRFITARHSGSLLVPKVSVMSNETQTDFWIMKILSDSLAVRIPVQLGIANDSIVEILSSELKTNDLTISEGAYGLSDSTVVKIVN
jgi:multidrug efflux pump subunit AcrA (membrane-fusion protein)